MLPYLYNPILFIYCIQTAINYSSTQKMAFTTAGGVARPTQRASLPGAPRESRQRWGTWGTWHAAAEPWGCHLTGNLEHCGGLGGLRVWTGPLILGYLNILKIVCLSRGRYAPRQQGADWGRRITRELVYYRCSVAWRGWWQQKGLVGDMSFVGTVHTKYDL